MGRPRKRKEIPLLPSNPVRLADALLYAEPEIRQAVIDERMSLSLLGSTGGQGTGHSRGIKNDRTAAAAMKLAEELAAVVLEDGRTIRRPEAWLEVFDEVRDKAKKCNRPEMIFETWESLYTNNTVFISADITPEIWRNIKSWIRYHVLTLAADAGLVDFDEEEITRDIEKAAHDWIWEAK